MMLVLIAISGFVWLFPLGLFALPVLRVWRGTADAIDVLLSPLAFIAANQVGFALRWIIFHEVIPRMSAGELLMWSGLYTLSTLSAVSSIVAWRVARGLR